MVFSDRLQFVMGPRIRTPCFRFSQSSVTLSVASACRFPRCARPIRGPFDPVRSTLGADFGFELADGTQHVEQKSPCGMGGVDVLVQNL